MDKAVAMRKGTEKYMPVSNPVLSGGKSLISKF